MPVWSNDDWLTCLKEKELIINMVLVTYSILAAVLKMATGKWRSIYFRQDMCKIDFFPIFLIKQDTLSNYYKFLML